MLLAQEITMTMHFDSRAAPDGALESGMADGVATSYDRLEEMLKSDSSQNQ